MKVLSIGINNQYVTFFESDAKDFYRIKNVEFRICGKNYFSILISRNLLLKVIVC